MFWRFSKHCSIRMWMLRSIIMYKCIVFMCIIYACAVLFHVNDPQCCWPSLHARPDFVWISFMTLVSWRCFVASIGLSRVWVLADIKLICPITYLTLSWFPSKNGDKPKQALFEKTEHMSSFQSLKRYALIPQSSILLFQFLAAWDTFR